MKRLIGVTTAFMVMLALPLAAFAHVKNEKAYTWENGEKCTLNRSEISNGNNGGGFAKHTVWAKKEINSPWGQIDCATKWDRAPGWLAAKNVLMKYKKSLGKWTICVKGSFNYNGITKDVLNKSSYYQVPCNNGRYANWGNGWNFFNSKWRGGIINSTAHYLPAD